MTILTQPSWRREREVVALVAALAAAWRGTLAAARAMRNPSKEGIPRGAPASMFLEPPEPRSTDMRTEKIRELVEQGILLVAPYRPRSPRDIPLIRAALAHR